MELITIFDKTYSDDKQAEGLGVNWAFVSGACSKCKHLSQCESDVTFVFPENAACMIRKKEIIREQEKKGGECE